MMGQREKLKGGDEYDSLTDWRHCIRIARAIVKRRYRRRIRRERKIQDRIDIDGQDNR